MAFIPHARKKAASTPVPSASQEITRTFCGSVIATSLRLARQGWRAVGGRGWTRSWGYRCGGVTGIAANFKVSVVPYPAAVNENRTSPLQFSTASWILRPAARTIRQYSQMSEPPEEFPAKCDFSEKVGPPPADRAPLAMGSEPGPATIGLELPPRHV